MRTAGSLAAGASPKGDASRALAVPACAVLSKPSSLASRAERTSSTARAVAETRGVCSYAAYARNAAWQRVPMPPTTTASRSLTPPRWRCACSSGSGRGCGQHLLLPLQPLC